MLELTRLLVTLKLTILPTFLVGQLSIPHDVGLAKIKMFMCKILIALEKANQYRADELIGLYQEKQMDA